MGISDKILSTYTKGFHRHGSLFYIWYQSGKPGRPEGRELPGLGHTFGVAVQVAEAVVPHHEHGRTASGSS